MRMIVACAVVLAAAPLRGQSGPPLPRMTNEARIDGRWSRYTSVEAGWSLIIPAGVYVRTALTAATGYTRREGEWERDSRYEGTARFVLDPFRQARYGLSIGGGLGLTNSEGLFSEPDVLGQQFERWRPFLVLLADLELRQSPGLTPAIQVGIGSGIRVGLVVRSAASRWR